MTRGALAITGVEGGGAPGGGRVRASRRWRRRGRAAEGGRRRGGARASVRERERDGLGRAGQEAKAQEEWGEGEWAGRRPRPRQLGRKPELGQIQEIKPFQILFEIQIFGKL
jgi:hypothetical protein